jgi:hypothetical protein
LEKSDEKWKAQLWLGQVKFGSENFGCSTQTADWETKITEQTSSNSFAKVKDSSKLAGTT